MKPKNSKNIVEEKNPILKQYGYTLFSKQLGTGAFSTVETAYSSQHKSEVAVKIIPKINAARDFLTKFLPRELDIMKKLVHPNIVMFLQAIETNVKIYLILELVKGGSILKAIHRKRRIQEDVAGNIMFQICNGLEYCHNKGIAHRDLKCENILLDTKGHVKIIDFGFACDNLLPIAGKYIRSSTFCGSYAYASPEILQGIPYVPQLSDVWSLGVILYVMLHGHLPFEDVNLKRLIRLVLVGPVFRPEVTLTPEAESIILFVLRKESTRPHIEDVKQHPWLKMASTMVLQYVSEPDTESNSPAGSQAPLGLNNT